MVLARCFFLASFFLILSPLLSQQISGYVRDSMGMAFSYASVVAISCEERQIIDYTYTDDKGKYKLTIKTNCDSITLTARILGYSTQTLRLAVLDLPSAQDFVLASTVLQEVVVRGKTPPVIARNDTTEYNVASFSDSTEVSVEDLLKKLPGVRVAENGLITYNGKTIERVMIDGDDLFSENYTLATRNIRADLISKVQVIDRFQENPLMKGIEESDRMVMNLKIKSERKRALSGSAEMGGGYGDEWKGRAHTNLFSLSRKDKIYLIGNANNSGDNAISDVEWTARGGFQGFGKQQTLQANPLNVREVLQSPPLETAGFPSSYTQTNQSGLIYLGLVLPGSPAFKTKISGWAGEVGLRQTSGNFTHYALGSDLIDVAENKFVKKRNRTFNIQTESEYFSLDKKHALRGFFKVGSKPVQHNFNLLRHQTGGDDFKIVSQSGQRIFDVFGSFEYTLKQNESAAFQIISKTAWYQNRFTLNPQYAWYASFFGLNASFNQLRQTVVQQEGESIFMGRWLARLHAVQWQAEVGMDWNWGRIQSDVYLENDSGEQWNPGADYQNDARLQAPRYFANLSATRTFGPLLLRGRMGTSYRPVQLQAVLLSLDKIRLWAVEPRIDLRYTVNKYAVLSSYYGFQQELPDLIDLQPAFIFSDYQLTTRGLPDLTLLSGHQTGLQYRYNNQLRQFSWNIGGSMSRNKNQFGTAYQINPFLIMQEKFRPVDRLSYGVNGGADHYLRNIHSRFEIGFGLNFLQETAKLNSETSTSLSQKIYAVNLGYGTAFDTWVNVVLSSQNVQITGRNTSGNPATHSSNWFSTAQIKVKPNKRFDLKIFIHQVVNRVGSNPYNIGYASDAVAYLRLNKWRSSISFSAVNLFGSRQYEQVFANAFAQSITHLTAVKRFFLLSWEKSF